MHSRKVRMEAVGVIINKTGDTITIDKKEGEEGSEGNNTATTAAVGTTPTPDESHTHDETHDETEDMSENESEGTQPEEVRPKFSNKNLEFFENCKELALKIFEFYQNSKNLKLKNFIIFKKL